jgi:hypothetical protein
MKVYTDARVSDIRVYYNGSHTCNVYILDKEIDVFTFGFEYNEVPREIVEECVKNYFDELVRGYDNEHQTNSK